MFSRVRSQQGLATVGAVLLAYGIMVLPKPKRRAFAAIYAFAREVDDVADGDAPADEKRARLEELHRRLDLPPNGDAMWIALADARERFPINEQALHDLVDGGLADLDRQRYETFDELRDYCRGKIARYKVPRYVASCVTSGRTGSSAACTCRRTNSPRSASPRRTSRREG